MSDRKTKIKQFIIENFLFGNADNFNDETSFLDEGVIDSTGVLELVTFIEEEFSIQIDDEDLVPENLDSLNNIDTYLKNKIELISSTAT